MALNTRRNLKWICIPVLAALSAVTLLLGGCAAVQQVARVGAYVAASSTPPAPAQVTGAGGAAAGSRGGAAAIVDAPGTFRFGVAGDLGGAGAAITTFEALAAAKPDFFLAIGDLSYDEIAPEKAWCSYVKGLLGDDYPFEVLIGNHEQLPTSNSGFIGNFAKCLPDRLGEQGRYAHRYFIDYPAENPIARFILIDPNLPRGDRVAEYCKDGEKSSCNWLKERIDEAQRMGLWTIVGMHKVCLSVGKKSCEVGADLLNVLLERKVDLVLQGHEHGFQRSHQLSLGPDCPAVEPETFNPACIVDDNSDDGFTRGAGTIFYITAAFGQDPYAVNPDDPEAGYMATWMDKETESKGYMEFAVADDQMAGWFVNVTGPFTDTISIGSQAAAPAVGD